MTTISDIVDLAIIGSVNYRRAAVTSISSDKLRDKINNMGRELFRKAVAQEATKMGIDMALYGLRVGFQVVPLYPSQPMHVTHGRTILYETYRGEKVWRNNVGVAYNRFSKNEWATFNVKDKSFSDKVFAFPEAVRTVCELIDAELALRIKASGQVGCLAFY